MRDLGCPHSFMARAEASLASFGTSVTTMSCLASSDGAMNAHMFGFSFRISSVNEMLALGDPEVVIRIVRLIQSVGRRRGSDGEHRRRPLRPLSSPDLFHCRRRH
ncbi:hypothetical protein IEQ34_007554 [Dendrobium chrysotoxum]|uniref:Uncharacterized protein n=1 Tax=Dendrobium chrysotoxum TaxID=161865 RepID=A0AAV7H252_DENCH|nr:hypothetical protein IEQ34_007554 [Dendrobium chrysotoxum]